MRKLIPFALLSLLATLATAQHPLCDGGTRFYAPQFAVDTTFDVQYGRNARYNGDSINLRIDIYSPVGDAATNRPVVLLAHGGTFLSGSKSSVEVTPLCHALAARGYVAVSLQYRLDDLFNFIAQGNPAPVKALIRAVQDMKAAVRFLRRSVAENGNPYGIDTNLIVVGGSSAGAFTALHSAYINNYTEFSQFSAISNHQAVWDDLGGLEGASGNPGYGSQVQGVVNLCGGLGLATWVEDNDVPLISMHGTADGTVPYAHGTFGMGTISIALDGSYVIDSVAHTRTNTFSRLYTWYGADHTPYVASQAYRDTTIRFVVDNLYEIVCQTAAPVGRREAAAAAWASAAYPNPVHAGTPLRVALEGTGTAHLLDLNGRVVATASASAGQVELPTQGLAPGVYALRLLSAGRTHTQRVVVQ
jgi:poly(3-hydroxybutyrate) depolymerase